MYVRIRPTDDALASATVTDHVRRLHGLDGRPDGWWRRLFAGEPEPIEFLLVADGDDERSIDYYAGVVDEARGDQLERILRGLFPDSYELTTVDRPTILDPEGDHDGTPAAAVEYMGVADRREDWQTQLTAFNHYHGSDHARVPLAGVVESMANHGVPMVYQALLRPEAPWPGVRDSRMQNLEHGQDSLGHQIVDVVWPSDPDSPIPAGDEARIEELHDRNVRRSFAVTARAAVFTRDDDDTPAAERAAADLAGGLDPVSGTTHRVSGSVATGSNAESVAAAMRTRRAPEPEYERLWTALPLTTNGSRTVVADPSETPGFCLLDGAALTTGGDRALATTPAEQTPLPRPPDDQLSTYRCEGLALGRPLDQDDTSDGQPVAVPPALQPLHQLWLGKTGSGKSTALLNAMLANHGATEGPDILVERKGDGMAREYLRAHYCEYGSLADVYYFDCTDTLPALSFFDIRDRLAAGVDRASAVEDVVEHYVEMLKSVMGPDRYEQAVRSPDAIRYLLTAMFDPVHGDDAFTHREFQATVQQMAETRDAPAVSDPDLQRMLGGLAANSKRSFDEVMQGVTNRIEKIPMHDHLRAIFNHVPDASTPQFDVADVLGEDAVVILDVGGLRSETQRVLTLVVLSTLWTALTRRTGTHPTSDGDGGPSLVNLYLEEAADIAHAQLVADLLAQSRSFGLSVTLAMQFPGQLRERNRAAYAELVNNVSTVVTGNVGVDRDLTRRLATADMPPSDVGDRLRSLSRGEWLTSLPAPFNDPEPRPFKLASLPLPPGHPDGPQPLDDQTRAAVDAAITRAAARTHTDAGIPATPTTPTPPATPATTTDDDTDDDEEDAEATESPPAKTELSGRIATTLPFTNRLPNPVRYDDDQDVLQCRDCERPQPPSLAGLKRAINCCHTLDAIKPANVPTVVVDLLLSADERAALAYSDRQLAFLQVVVNAQRRAYDSTLEYDIVTDSMTRLQAYVGLSDDAIQQLEDDGLLAHDGDHPHRLYSVTADGRALIDETPREGIDHGDGTGDLGETSQHILGIELARRTLERAYADHPDSPVTTVQTYYETADDHRLDLVGLDDDGDIVVTVEVERINHDVITAVPADYDKMAACNPTDALWVTMTQSAGHRVLVALNDPPDGDPRVEKTYSPTTPPPEFRLDADGCSGIYSVTYLRRHLEDPPIGPDSHPYP